MVKNLPVSARFGSTKIGTIQRRLAWPLHKDDTQIREAFHILKKKKKNLPVNAGDRFDPWVGKIWRRKCQPTPGFLPGESHGPRNLAGYSLWGHKESDMT